MSIVHERITQAAARTAFEAIAQLFRYPNGDCGEAIELAWRATRAIDAHASDILERFAMHAAVVSCTDMQLTYTDTFDVRPACSPYVGDHLFPNDDASRVELMVSLQSSYRKHGIDEVPELPDHVADVLWFASLCDEDEWEDLGGVVLLPALAAMDAVLRPTDTPYRHLVAAARRLIAVICEARGVAVSRDPAGSRGFDDA